MQQLSVSRFDEEISREQSKVLFHSISNGIHDEFRESDDIKADIKHGEQRCAKSSCMLNGETNFIFLIGSF